MRQTTGRTLAEALAWHHEHSGLDVRYDDVLEARHAAGVDVEQLLAVGHHYDYRAQEWVPGHDHAHVASNDDGSPLLFCGTDAVTCYGGAS